MNLKNTCLIFLYWLSVCTGCGGGGGGHEAELDPPPNHNTFLQEAIDSLPDGGVLMIAPGIYRENLVVLGKVVHLQGSPKLTIIDGQGGTCLTINNASGSTVSGLTFVNGEDGLSTDSTITIEDNHFINNADGVDYEGGGGLLKNNVFHMNGDDAVDLDEDTAVGIIDNLISASGDDGIEIRLHPHDGEALSINVQGNTLTANHSNGIQLIDYEVDTNRSFEIAGNTFIENGYSGIAYSDNQDTSPSFNIGDISESVAIINNTFFPLEKSFTGTGSRTRFQGNTVFSKSGDGDLNTTGDLPVADNVFIQLY